MRRAPASMLCLVVIAACDHEVPPQLVVGRIDPLQTAPIRIVEARGWSADVVAASSGVDAAGELVLALPAGATYRLELAGSGGESIRLYDPLRGPALEVRVCEPGEPVDLGMLMLGATNCSMSNECQLAAELVQSCLMLAMLMCERDRTYVAECAPLRDQECTAMDPSCFDRHRECYDAEARLAQECGPDPCPSEQARFDALCSEPAACELAFFAPERGALSDELGCNGSDP